MAARSGKTKTGSHEYKISETHFACRMGDDRWFVFKRTPAGIVDTGVDRATLKGCRQWASNEEPA